MMSEQKETRLPEKPYNPQPFSRNPKLRRNLAIKNIIWQEMLKGVPTRRITQNLKENVYNTGEIPAKDAKLLVAQVVHDIKKEYEDTIPVMKERLTATLFSILERCAVDNDKSNAIKAVQEIAKLTGAYSSHLNGQSKIKISFGFKDEDVTVEGEVIETEEEDDGT